MRRASLLLSLALLVGLWGCAMTGGEEDGGSGGKERKVDSVHLRNGDVLVGEVVLRDDQIQIKTEYLKDMQIEKRHLESFKVLASGEIKVYTKHGDILHGTLTGGAVELRAKTGKDFKLGLDAIEKVTFAE
jgi:hypothetical protein